MSDLLEAWWRSEPAFAPSLCEPLLRTCAAHLEPLPPGSLFVDVGCGDAHMVRALEGVAFRAIGLDAEMRMLTSRARGAKLICASGEQLPLQSESVDAVFVFSAFQYMQRETVLAECHRILKRGGRFAVVENLAGNPFAKLERVRRWLFRVAHTARMKPLRHLSWRGRTIYERFFSEVRYEAHHIVAPAFLASRTIRAASDNESRRSLVAKTLRGVQRIEHAFLKFPGAAALAWHVVIYGRK
jgi:SAM-dependent methyltransferase